MNARLVFPVRDVLVFCVEKLTQASILFMSWASLTRFPFDINIDVEYSFKRHHANQFSVSRHDLSVYPALCALIKFVTTGHKGL